MSQLRQAFLLVLSTAAALSSRPLLGQPKPVRPEIRVDSGLDYYLVSDCPRIALAPDRSFEIAWSAGPEGAGEVRARHFDANGRPTDKYDVAVLPDSDYGNGILGGNALALTAVSNGFRVLFRLDFLDYTSKLLRHRIDPKGVPAPGASRPVGAPGTQWVLPGPGDTVLAGGYDAARRLLSLRTVDSEGTPTGTEYILNSRPLTPNTADYSYSRPDARPVIQPLSDGGWVAVFDGISVAAPGAPARPVLRARRFSAAGAPLGPDFDVNSLPAGLPGNPPYLGTEDFIVTALPAGRFAVAWSYGSRSTGWPIYIRYFDAAGTPLGPETVAAQEREGPSLASMASDDTGRILLVWIKPTHLYDGFPTGALLGRLLQPNGKPVGQPIGMTSWVSDNWGDPWCGTVVWAGDSWLFTWVGGDFEAETATFVRRFKG
jgi:hypothetical protein